LLKLPPNLLIARDQPTPEHTVTAPVKALGNLYNRVDVIPFDKLTDFFTQRLGS
jgi:hypothetical protein